MPARYPYRGGPMRTHGYVLRSFPAKDQAHRFNQLIGQGRFLWNWLLNFQETRYADVLSLHSKAGSVILNLAITQKLAAARAAAARVLTHPANHAMWGEHCLDSIWFQAGPAWSDIKTHRERHG